MGDRDGARELYQEAVSEGSPAQQEAARAKLAALG
jgi:FimV-like protein